MDLQQKMSQVLAGLDHELFLHSGMSYKSKLTGGEPPEQSWDDLRDADVLADDRLVEIFEAEDKGDVVEADDDDDEYTRNVEKGRITFTVPFEAPEQLY